MPRRYGKPHRRTTAGPVRLPYQHRHHARQPTAAVAVGGRLRAGQSFASPRLARAPNWPAPRFPPFPLACSRAAPGSPSACGALLLRGAAPSRCRRRSLRCGQPANPLSTEAMSAERVGRSEFLTWSSAPAPGIAWFQPEARSTAQIAGLRRLDSYQFPTKTQLGRFQNGIGPINSGGYDIKCGLASC